MPSDDDWQLDHRVGPPPGGPVGEAMRSRIASRLFGVDHKPVSIGRFEVRHVLGAGGMGIVYAATDPKLDRLVALKLLGADQIADERQRERLIREARALAKLAHPNVVGIHEVGEHEDGIFIVMEHVDGVPLHHWQRDARRSLPDLLAVYLQAAEGLCAAHAAGVVHRDFKPSNVLVGADGRVRVADFGLARLGMVPPAASEGETATGTPNEITRSAVLGTPAYMSPEQAIGELADASSDQFSLCVALWEAVFGVRPWEPTQLRSMATNPEAALPPAVRRPGPRWLRRVLVRGLASRPGSRWPSIASLQQALRSGALRRRRLVLGTGLLGLGAVIAAAMWPSDTRCEDPSPALTGVWDEERSSTLRERVSASSARFATDALPSVQARLDAYAREWVAARSDACEATYLRGEQSEEQFDRSVACLERGRHALGAGVDTLVGATPEVIAQAESLLDQLPAPATCRDTLALRDGPTPPHASIADEVEEVQRNIDRAGLLQAAGRVEEALALAQTARERARSLAYVPAIAHASLIVGQGLAAKGDLRGAQVELFAAATAAMGSRSHGLAVRAWHRLVELAAIDLESAERASEWQALAGTAIQLTGEPGMLAAEHLDHEGLSLSAGGDYERAAELHRLAAERLASGLPADDLRVIQVEVRSANALLNQGISMSGDAAAEKIRAAEALYATIEERVTARFGVAHPEQARTNHNLGLVALVRGDAQEATRRFQASLDILSAAFGPQSLRIAPALTAMGRLAMDAGDLERAADLGARAWAIQAANLPRGHSERGSGLSLLAQVSLRLRELDESLAQHRQLADEFAEGPSATELPMIHQNIGWILCELDRCTEAREANGRARELAQPGQPIQRYIDALTARILLAEGDTTAAITRADRLLSDADANAADDAELRAELRWTLASALAIRGSAADLRRAIDLVTQASQLYEHAHVRADALPKLEALRQTWRAVLDRRRG